MRFWGQGFKKARGGKKESEEEMEVPGVFLYWVKPMEEEHVGGSMSKRRDCDSESYHE